MDTTNTTKTVLAGIRPTSRLHVGNYLGAVKGMVELQDKGELTTYYMVADLHTLTTPYNKEELENSVKQVFLDYLACGLNPNKSTIFIQSQILEHAYFNQFLASIINIAKLLHLPTYKEKIKQYPQNASLALLNYPVLMASDILLYKASFVPVGKDQEPHMEIARESAKKLNNEYKTKFPIPKTYSTPGSYVPSLTGLGKMSKSVEGSSIFLTDSLEEIKKKIAKIPTDTGKGDNVPNEGGVFSLLKLVELFVSQEEKQRLEKDYLSIGIKYGEIKQGLSEVIFKYLQPIQQKRLELENNNKYLHSVIEEGNQKAQLKAHQTVQEVRECFGLSYKNL